MGRSRIKSYAWHMKPGLRERLDALHANLKTSNPKDERVQHLSSLLTFIVEDWLDKNGL